MIEKPASVTGEANWVGEFFTTRFWVWFEGDFLKALEPPIGAYDPDINTIIFSN